MTHDDLDKLYDRVLGRGLYSPQVLVPRIKRALAAAGFEVELESSDDLRKLPAEALPAAADYLTQHTPYEASPDAEHAARLTRKAG
jgi:hypothetical protein